MFQREQNLACNFLPISMFKIWTVGAICNSALFSRWNCKYHIVFAPEISEKSILPRKAISDRENIEATLWVERCKDHRSRFVPKPHTSILGNTAENIGVTLYGVFERKKQHDAVWAIRRTEIQVPKQRILVPRILCGYSWKEWKPNCGVRKKSTERRWDGRTIKTSDK